MLFFLSSIPNFFSKSFYSSRTSLPLRSLQQKFSSTYISYLLFIQRLFIIFFYLFSFFYSTNSFLPCLLMKKYPSLC
jgi:hypothetical protein